MLTFVSEGVTTPLFPRLSIQHHFGGVVGWESCPVKLNRGFKIKMKPITREELELEKITPIKYANIYCNYKLKCSRAGSYMRCGTDLSALCPFYASYHAQEKERRNCEMGKLEEKSDGR